MDRRNFIRLTAAGSASVATVTIAGCGQQMLQGAIAAWKGPGEETDLRRWILGYAVLAPHSHNLPSWLVDIRQPDEILLRCDLTRLLPETDPFSRQIMMSHGTFLELLDIATRERGLRAEISLFPEGPFGPSTLDQRPVARIGLVPDATVPRDPLFAQILNRRTNRSAHDSSRAVPPDAWAAMARSVTPNPLRFGFVGLDQADTLKQHLDIAALWRDSPTAGGAATGADRADVGLRRLCDPVHLALQREPGLPARRGAVSHRIRRVLHFGCAIARGGADCRCAHQVPPNEAHPRDGRHRSSRLSRDFGAA